MKQYMPFILLLIIAGILLFILMIPAIQEREYAKTHPEFLKDAYDLNKASINVIDSSKIIKTTK